MPTPGSEPFGVRPRICPHCPFLGVGHGGVLGAGLRTGRRQEIADSLLRGQTFPCHMEANGELETPLEGVGRQCTGGATVLARMGESNQVMQVADRLGEEPFVESPGVPWHDLGDWVDQGEYEEA